MIRCNTKRNGITHPLAEYARYPDPRLSVLLQQAGLAPISQTKALLKIEDFVDTVLASPQPAYLIKHTKAGDLSVRPTPMGERLLQTLPLLGMFDSFHDYSEKPYAFLDACWLVEAMQRLDLTLIGFNPEWGGLNYPNELNGIVDKIRLSSRNDWFLRGPSDRSYESRGRAQRIGEYVANLLAYYAKLLLVRVDFQYPEEFRVLATMDRLCDDVGRFLRLKEWQRWPRKSGQPDKWIPCSVGA